MSLVSDAWVFAGVMVLGQFSPGPDMLLLTRTALRFGPVAGLKMAMGVACGLTVHATLAVAGMAMVFERFPRFSRMLQVLAAVYLGWLAWRMGRAFFRSGPPTPGRAEETAALDSPFVRGLVCNLLNPKVAVFLAAACAPFLAGERPGWWPAAIWGIIVGLGWALWSLWVLWLQWPPLKTRYEKCERWIDAMFALVLAGLAIRLLIGG